jgi:hypothetical protein
MSDLIPFEGGQMPAHISRMFSGTNEDLQGGLFGTYPIISIKGKVWHIVEGDKRTLVCKPGQEPGQEDPSSSLPVVILKANPNKSKLYYEGGYEEGSVAKPTCYSDDGKAPALDVQAKQNDLCATCPRNVWGSKITENGSKGRECGDSRRMAVATLGRLDRPMLLRVPAGSLQDLGSYASQLDGRRVTYTAVVTKISFDHSVAHQKFVFKAERFVTEEEAEAIVEVSKKDIIQQIIGVTPHAAAVTHETDTLGTPPAHVKATPIATKPKARAAVVTEAELEEAVEVIPEPVKKAGVNGSAKKAAPKEVIAAARVPAVKPKFDESALLAEADASLDEALSALDD